MEFEGKAWITPDIEILGSAAYQQNEDDQGTDHTTFNPEVMLKGGVSYNIDDSITAAIWYSYLVSRRVYPGLMIQHRTLMKKRIHRI